MNCNLAKGIPDIGITGYKFSTTPNSPLYAWYVNQNTNTNSNANANACSGSGYKRLGEVPWCNKPLSHYTNCEVALLRSRKNY